jgi:hypothetical protein
MRKSLIVSGLVLVLAVSACDKGDSQPSPSAEPKPSTASGSPVIDLAAGQYGYEAYGVEAVLSPKGGQWTLEVSNSAGTKLDAPGIYVLDARDGHQIDATVEGAKPLADKEKATLTVTWPPDFDEKQIGMVILTIGGDNYGAFIRG